MARLLKSDDTGEVRQVGTPEGYVVLGSTTGGEIGTSGNPLIVSATAVAGAVSSQDYNYGVTLGLVAGSAWSAPPGRQPSAATTEKTIWAHPSVSRVDFATVASTWTLVSSVTTDTAAGTGLQSVFFVGLLADYTIAQEVVVMNGTTEVQTANQYIRWVATIGLGAGSNEGNAGDITVGNIGQFELYAHMAQKTTTYPGNFAGGAYLTIPDGMTGIIVQPTWSVASGKAVNVNQNLTPFGGLTTAGFNFNLVEGAARFEVPGHDVTLLPAKTDLEATCFTDTGSASLFYTTVVLLVANA